MSEESRKAGPSFENLVQVVVQKEHVSLNSPGIIIVYPDHAVIVKLLDIPDMLEGLTKLEKTGRLNRVHQSMIHCVLEPPKLDSIPSCCGQPMVCSISDPIEGPFYKCSVCEKELPI